MANKIKMIKRTFNRKAEVTCKSCGEVIKEGYKEYSLEMPYCNECGKIVFDINQNYCAWCGVKFSED